MNGPITGLGVALATPFTTGAEAEEATAKRSTRPAQGRLDPAAYARLVEHVVTGGVDHVVVLGSTGEAATVSDEERDMLVRLTVEVVDRLAATVGRRVPVVVGVGHNATERTCELARAAVDAGADGLLVVTPYYNKPQPAGLEAHYRAVAAAAPGTPIVAYNVPGRTGCNLTPGTLQRLWSIPEVVAVKESSGDIRQISRICHEAPPGKTVLAGDDDIALAAIAVGCQGLVSVAANVAPRQVAALVEAARHGELETARRLDVELAPLASALFCETNPVPVKAALACLGLGTGLVRPPLAPAEPDTWARVQAALSGLGLGRASLPTAAATTLEMAS
ncbi:4-hydroxy-tetrahydrodipicolinate synthase [Ornithinicoccus halotolerans]|uniref:4-hydroxy-tetrahydrodipicolinate synthase n=1 Tax=Ornithinicoccus halotolerans TaxID=1748220 RepID=UPI001296E294|nr:4-hydroxy-tetrahydrodipicolinate synthase [Ornithinicoccus halotolerans]